MEITIDERPFECYLIDDGTLDTVIQIDGIEHRFSSEYVKRDEDRSLSDEEFYRLAEEVIESDERHW